MTQHRTVTVLPSVTLIHDTCLKRWLRFRRYQRQSVYVTWRWPWERCS